MKMFDSVIYFLPIPTGEMEHLKHPSDAVRIIHSVALVKRQPVSAIVVGVHEGDLLDVVFVHPQRIPTLSSGDWYNAMERAYGVRPEGHADLVDGDERLGYYEPFPDLEDLKKFADAMHAGHERDVQEKNELRTTVLELTAKLAETTEGRDETLQAMADEHAVQPSAADPTTAP